MPRKNKEQYTTISIKKTLLEKLKKLKIHKNQPYSEVIERIVREFKK